MYKNIKLLVYVFLLSFIFISCNKENQEVELNKTKKIISTKMEDLEIEKDKKTSQDKVTKGIESYEFEEYNNTIRLVLTFYRDIKNKDLNSYINIQGTQMNTKLNITYNQNKVFINESFLPGTDYNITLFKGLTGLEKNHNFTVKVPSKEPNIEFKSSGIYMTSSSQKKLRIRTLNLEKANLKILKVSSDNINLYKYRGNFKKGKNSSASWSDFKAIKIYDGEIHIKGKKDTWIDSDIDLSIFDNDKNMVNGLYIVRLEVDNDDTILKKKDHFYKSIEKTIIISDLGILVKKYNENTVIFIKDLNTNLPIDKAEIVVDLNKYLTDKDGKVVVPNTSWKDIFVKKDRDFAFIDSSNYIDYTLADNEGTIKKEGIDSYIYLTQGVFRPGDEINISTILSEKEKKLPDNQNLIMEIYTPKRGLYTTINGKSQGNSLYTFKFSTKENDFTGDWTAKLYIGEVSDEGFINSKKISIETIVPPLVEIKDNSKILKDELIVDTNTKYLFGTPGNNLNYKVTISNSISKDKFKGYSNFNFVDNTNTKFDIEKIKEGKLDIDGNMIEKFSIDTTNPPYILDYHIKTEVFQKDGRKVIKNKTLSYSPYGEYVGIENKDYGYYEVGEDITMRTILLSKNNKEINRILKYTVYKNTSLYWWDYSNYDEYKKHYKSSPKTMVITQGEVNSGDNIKFKLPDYGSYYVELTDPKNNHSSGTLLKGSYWGDSDTKNDTFVKLDFNNIDYNIGDDITVTFKSPSSGKAIINIESEKKLIQNEIIDLQEGKQNYTFKVTKDMYPGAYFNIIMLQDLKKKENDRELKLQGLRYFKVKNKDKIIPIEIINKKIYKDPKNVNITIKGKPGISYTIAAVDVGVLNLTNFKTPDPYDYFTRKQRYQVGNYDNYKLILDFQKDPAFNIFKPGGGDALTNKREGSLSKKPRFKIASQFKSGTINSKGEANIVFDLGNYMGKIKFMVVGVDSDKLGKVDSTSEIRGDLVLLPGVPRSLAPEDQFESNLTIFVNEKFEDNAIVSLKTEGPIDIIGNNKYRLDGSKVGEYNFDFNLKVLKSFGQGKLIYTVKDKDNIYTNKINIDVEPKLDSINYSESYIIEPNSEIDFITKKEAIKDSSTSKMIISKFPLNGLYGRLRYLIKYPYGCLEQTTSSIFPQLYVDNFMELSPKEKDEINENLEKGIERLEKFQLGNGSMSYWIGEDYTSEWGTNYAYFFLLSAIDKGYYVPEKMINKLRTYMIKTANSTREISLTNIQRLFLLALDKNENISAMNYYKQNSIKDMSSLNKLLLASSYDLVGYKDVARSIYTTVDLDQIGYKDSYWRYSFGSSTRDQSLALLALKTLGSLDEKNKFQEKILSILSSDQWLSTQGSAYALLAISKNIENSDNKLRKYSYSLDSSTEERIFNGNNESISLDKIHGEKIKIKNLGESKLYLSYYFEGVVDPSDQVEYSNELGLKVRYFTEDGKEIPLLETLKKGQSIWAIYDISKTRNSNYSELVFNQNIASGIEIENLRLQGDNLPKWLTNYSEYNLDLRYMDIRDRRVSYFFDLIKGSYYHNKYKRINDFDHGYIIVKLNAVTKGNFYMPGATLKDMYHDEIGAGLKGFPIKVE